MIDLLRILIAPLVWLAAFSGIYGLHGVGCAYGWSEITVLSLSLFRVALLASWGATVLIQIGLLLALCSDRFGSGSLFVRRVSVTLGWVGLVAAIWTLHPVAILSSCS
ncbi:hypothetical protein JSE7799_00182 [Jannaschia seosinensis]|uniref:Uncharacterized protein n=1 Tax=Jannaschia seosinensis TaxID=313367 RepID=A0A0M7B5L3_9RHOB|nr:hypothetical protein [Jannaschia seosinensis]CUH11476.1 hypothetical protein JSE7799_00182 [Jannaschia seosinensis]